MYSPEWFSTFSATVPPEVVEREVEGLARLFSLPDHRRLLDVGCGIGRVAGPLAARGYSITGIDINTGALRQAQRLAPGPTYVALDQQHVGLPEWQFDGAFVLWNSIGFINRTVDEITLTGLARVIRPDGVLVLDMYHPEWLEQIAPQPSPRQSAPEVTTERWVEAGRLHNRIDYGGGRTDSIDFEIYRPEELVALIEPLGFEFRSNMVWWDSLVSPSSDHARYQSLFRRSSSPLREAAV